MEVLHIGASAEGAAAVGQCAVLKQAIGKQAIGRRALGGIGRCGTSGRLRRAGRKQGGCILARRGPRHARCKRIALGGVAAGLPASAERREMWDKRDRIGTRESTKRRKGKARAKAKHKL